MEDFASLLKQFEEFTARADARFEELKAEYKAGDKTLSEANEERDKAITRFNHEVAALNTKMSELAKDKLKGEPGLVRQGIKGIRGEYTPLEAYFGAMVTGVEYAPEVVTMEQFDAHLAALEAADYTRNFSTRHPKRLHNEMMRRLSRDQHQFALDSSGTAGGTPSIVSAEMYPRIAESAQLYPLIPMDPTAAVSGRITSATPIGATVWEATRDEATDFTMDDGGQQSPVNVVAATVRTRRKITEAYIEDYAFGSALEANLDAIITDLGPQLDALVLFGDTSAATSTATAGNINGQGDDVGNSVDNSDKIQRYFDGYVKGKTLANAVAAATSGTLTIGDLTSAIGSMGQAYGNPTDLIIASSHASRFSLLDDAKVRYEGGGRAVEVAIETRLGGIPSVTVDLLNTGRNAAGRVTASGTRSLAVVLNRRAMKVGFARGPSSAFARMPGQNYSWLSLSVRWLQHLVNGTSASAVIRDC